VGSTSTALDRLRGMGKNKSLLSFVLQCIRGQNQYQKPLERLFLKNAENPVPESLSTYFMSIKALFKPVKSTSHNLHYVRFAVLGLKTDSYQQEEVRHPGLLSESDLNAVSMNRSEHSYE
jgi:hypothetical protein